MIFLHYILGMPDKYYTKKDFQCTQCGKCCRTLDIQKLLVPEDVQRWRKQNAEDILRFAGMKEENRNVVKAWFQDPITGKQIITNCPFSIILNGKAWCRIYDTRPIKCAQWPFTALTAVNPDNPISIDPDWYHLHYPECKGFSR